MASGTGFPAKDTDITKAVSLCKSFLIHRNLLNLAGRLSERAITESKAIRNSMQVASFVNTVNLTPLLTPGKSSSSKSRKQSRALPTSPLSQVHATVPASIIRLRERDRALSPTPLPRVRATVHKFSKRSADSSNIGWTEASANYEKRLLEEDSAKKRRVHKQRKEDEAAAHVKATNRAKPLADMNRPESRRPFDRDRDMDGARRLDIKRKGSTRGSKDERS